MADGVSLPSPVVPAIPTAMSAAELAKRGEIQKTAQKFEAQFLTQMLGQMFDGVGESGDDAFTGGQGAAMFKSFMTEAIANKTAASGGVGISQAVAREMLKLRGLT